MTTVQATRLTAFSHGGGCGCKLSPDELASIIGPLRSHPALEAPELVVGLATSDDAAVWQLPSGDLLLQSVDFFTPVVDDAYDWGQIAAANALSDIYAMGGRPLTALQLVAWPRKGLSFDLLGEVMKGGADMMAEAGATIVGGHSIDDAEPKYGFAVTGIASDPITNAAAQPGDQLVLTKPLGTGIVTTALKSDSCPPELAQRAVDLMTALNDRAVQPMIDHLAHAATDVTGFGLLGHLREMLVASNVAAVLDPEAVPILDGVMELVEDGHYPGGSWRNLESLRPFLAGVSPDEKVLKILADAQTSGGLLIAVAPDRTEDLVADLLDAGTMAAAIVGGISPGEPAISFVSR
ncbi:MAG TPA: selenide, water dikinase SelD [Acidimicrobiia bacterium]|nr:selenide, water dikinase SelD [Acidimicrobiia bacterium]